MPNVFVYWLEGKNKEQKKTVADGMTKVLEDAGIDRDLVTVGFIEISPENYSKGGVLLSDKEQK